MTCADICGCVTPSLLCGMNMALPIQGRMPCMHDCIQIGVYCQHQEGRVT